MANVIHIRTDAGIPEHLVRNGGKPFRMWCELVESYTRPRNCTRIKKDKARAGHEYCQSNLPQALFDLNRETGKRRKWRPSRPLKVTNGDSNSRIVKVINGDGEHWEVV